MTLPVNPYIAGAPLRAERGFFGRQDTLDWVERELRNSQTNALVLFGQRRIGKTTLLLQLARNLAPNEFIAIYFDLQDQASRPLGQTLADVADILCEKANLNLGQLGPFDDQGRYFQKEFLPRFYAAVGEKRRPVLLLDEFDVLDQTAEAALVETATAKALFPLLRRLMTTDGRSAFVFVVGRRAEDLSIDFSATFKASLVREIWVLDETSAESLICQAQTNGTLTFTEAAVQRILNLTNHHPYLTQLLCQRIWELAYSSSPSSPPKIDSAEVDLALESSLESGNQALDWLWNGLNPAEKIYASALAEIAGENETIPEERIIEVLATHAARLRTREIELAPQDLVKRHVLDLSGERGYRFAVELFRRWVHKNKPLLVVKDEVDRIDPMADRLFVFGDGFYDARQWEKAAFYFREALNVNPRHFRARLYLGETLLEQGKVDESIAELDQALVLDREEARLPLARAWLAKAELLKPQGNLDVLLQAYEKVLELSPRESLAIQGRASIWIQRAQQAEGRGDLSAAREAYIQAGDLNNVERLDRLERERVLNKLQVQAQEHVKVGRWESAASVYAQLVESALDENSRLAWQAELEKVQAQAAEQLAIAKSQKLDEMKKLAQAYEERGEWEKAVEVYENLIQMEGEAAWHPLLESARHQQDLAKIFEQGQQALAQEEWKEAQRLFAQVIQVRPDYGRNGLLAVDLLQDAIRHRKGPVRNIARRATYQAGRHRSVLKRLLIALAVVVGLCLGFVAIVNLYFYFQKPLSVGESFVLGIPPPEETITTANANRVELLDAMSSSAIDIDISPDSSLVAASFSAYGYYADYSAIVQLGSGSVAQVLYGHSATINSLDFSPDGSLLATGSNDGTVKIWNVQTGGLIRTLEGHSGPVNSVIFSPDGELLASGSSDNTVRIWHVSDGTLLRTLEGHIGTVYSVAFSPDGNLLASGSADNTARIWQVSEGALVHTLEGHTSTVNGVVFSPDGSLLASGSSDNTVRIWQVSDGTLLLTLEGHTGVVVSVDFSPDGSLLASGSNDKTARLWQVSDGTELATLLINYYSVGHVEFSPDGKLLAVIDSGDIDFWGINAKAVGTSTPLPTEVNTPTDASNIGYINQSPVNAWDETGPGLNAIGELGLHQVVTVLEKKEVSIYTWYKCRWVDNGVSREGWILAYYVTLGSPP
jgi:WD40 repeat protein